MKAFLTTCATLLLSVTMLHAQMGMDPMMPGGMGMPPPGGRGPNTRGGTGSDQIKQLQQQLSQEQKALSKIEDERRNDFEKTPAWEDALAAQQQAQAEHDAAREAVLATVYDTPEYKAALEKKFAAESQLQNLNATGEVDPEQLQEATNAIADSSSEIRKMEEAALAADPAFAETRQKLADANAKLNDLRKEFRSSLQLDEEYLNQSDRVEDLKFKLADARQRQADANRQKANSQRRNDTTRRPKKSGGGGGGPPGGMP